MTGPIIIYAYDGSYEIRSVDSFKHIIQGLEKSRRKLYDCPLDCIVQILDAFGKNLIRDPDLVAIPGLPYLSLWLRKENLNSIVQANFLKVSNSDNEIGISPRISMFPVPRGIVCHWIAENIPYLGVFSLVLATLAKNASILKISPELGKVFSLLLNRLEKTNVLYNGAVVSGKCISRSVAVVSFPGKNREISEAFSLVADCRIVYGSEDAVQTISMLAHRVHCETIVYGPKYSFVVFDKESITSSEFPSQLDSLANDIVLFNQVACSSPHVVFCEKNEININTIAHLLKNAFDRLPDHRYGQLHEGTVVGVINTRGRYMLDENREILCSSDMKWTICINHDLSLEEPVQGRCIFLKEVEDFGQILDLITRKVQTVSLAMENSERREAFLRELAYRGVDRVMTPGTMHEYTQPWDGILGSERMVRWVAVRRE